MATTEARAGLLYNIQALRALAAYLVVILHLESLLPLSDACRKALGLGAAGVDLFFVISGFIMVHTTAGRDVRPLPFVASRLARIVPLYWLLTLAVFVIALTVPSLLGSTTASPDHLVKSLLFIPFEKGSGAVQPMLPVGWTLNYEMFFYGLFGVSLLARDAVRVAVVCSSAIIGLVLIGQGAQPSSTIAAFYTAPIMLEFVMGMWLGVASFRRARLSRGWAGALLAVASGVLVLGSLLYPAGERVLWAGPPCAAIVWAAFSLEARGVALRNRLLQSLGAASYALYLSHLFITQGTAELGARLGLLDHPATAIPLATLAAAAAGWCALALERPIAFAPARRIATLAAD